MVISGNMFLFMALQFFYIWGVGMMSILFGWTAANPGVASSRMILFIPGGFILGGQAGPLIFIPEWVKILSHFFPLTWEFHFRFQRFAPDQARCILGASHLVWNAAGQVSLHRDYWDAAEELYEKLPVVGGLMRLIKRRLSATG